LAPPNPSITDPGLPWSKAFAWIEANVGGTIRHYERQPRWRPAFYLDVERNGETLPIYIRGARVEVENGATILEFEKNVLEQLDRDGIPVPHIYGYCSDPPGIVMERSAGRENLATADTREEAQAVLDEYIEILARIHSLDTGPYQAFGMNKPEGAHALGISDLPKWEANFRRTKNRPEPMLEFILAWLKRNVPDGRSQASFLCTDSGQFLFDKGRVTALIDLELASLGDPAADLAGMRGRDLSEPLGNLPRAFERYFELRGERIPTSVIDYHTVRFNMYTPLAISPIVANPDATTDLVQYLGWYWIWAKACFEVMAHSIGAELDELEMPDPAASRFASEHAALCQRLEKAGRGKDFAAYEINAAYRAAEYLRRAERYGAAFEQRDLEEIGSLLGRSFREWKEADHALEVFVTEAGPEHDADLIKLCHRRCQRHEALLQPVLRELEGVKTQLLPR